MSIIFDIILIVIAAAVICRGYRQGLLKSVMGLATNVVALIVAYAFSPYVSDWLFNNYFLSEISSGIKSTVASVFGGGGEYDFMKMVNEMPEVLSQMLEKYRVSESSLAEFVPSVQDAGESGVSKISEFIATPAASVISNVLAFIAVFIAALIVLKIVSALIAFVFKAPVLKTVDKTAGLILGIVNAVLILWILSLALSLGIEAAGSLAPSWFGEKVIQNSFVLKFFSEFNPMRFISSLLEYNG